MMTQRDGIVLVEGLINFGVPRVRCSWSLCQPDDKAIKGQTAQGKEDNQHQGFFVAWSHEFSFSRAGEL
jgi:hypothetical protein